MLAKIALPHEQLTALCHHYHIRYLALFGSVLRDDFGPESDVDVLVEFEPEARISLMDYIGAMQALSDLLQRPVDLVDRTGLKPRLKETVLQSAEVIYAA